MRFNLMGPFEIVAEDGRVCRPVAPKVCQTLALLLTRPNEVVTAESLIRELWGDRPPRSATTTLQTYVYHARRMFESERLDAHGRSLIVTTPPGYSIQVDDAEVDLRVFERLISAARVQLGQGDAVSALSSARKALALWRGPAFSSFVAGDLLKGHLAHLEELRIGAFELVIEAESRLGRHRELLPELRRLIAEYPLNEWFHQQLIGALSAAGRRAEALQAYQHVRRLLADELGLEPSVELQRLQLRLLDPAAALARAGGRPVAGRVPAVARRA
ncbi:AfsR/SARP family transcriptional regulator [Streptomyces sp. RerS4]|uniref:AfsR/SARP family transcriptional regulator n=1 Tax=Streptomyces sp. RerS4 TaxID=2942449 RepID=UPI00201BD34D|nr:AfsR/SARP family transcriptional regulator [Streptomyces sp. RerS4]UQX05470.1 AfsR/SARP family transcriptional regulator [Streptomyces sp. RerS4]